MGYEKLETIVTLSNNDKIKIDDHCYIIVSEEGQLRTHIYKEAFEALQKLKTTDNQ